MLPVGLGSAQVAYAVVQALSVELGPEEDNDCREEAGHPDLDGLFGGAPPAVTSWMDVMRRCTSSGGGREQREQQEQREQPRAPACAWLADAMRPRASVPHLQQQPRGRRRVSAPSALQMARRGLSSSLAPIQEGAPFSDPLPARLRRTQTSMPDLRRHVLER